MEDDIQELIKTPGITANIAKALMVTRLKIIGYTRPTCSISGGADSDTMLDIVSRCDPGKKVQYIFFDTGLEYQATKAHLDKLEKKYGIQIKRIKAIKPVPVAVKNYGVPWFSKLVSELIERLQRHGFQWEDEPYEVLIKKYPKASSSLKWWCNKYNEGSRFNIKKNRFMKEFLMANPPDFPISSKCCKYAKKDTANQFDKDNDSNLKMTGIRRSEGGIRAFSYKNCFTSQPDKDFDTYRPIFWFTDDDKKIYKEIFDLTYSDCYEVWGFSRTGCAGCPFNSRHAEELEKVKLYEPKLYNACMNIFGKSYEYTRKYRQFKKEYAEKLKAERKKLK